MPAWISVFKVIPWMDVIAAAPGVARGARKLWSDVRKPREGASGPVTMSGRVDALEAHVAELGKELAAASETIKAIAEQNARLVEAVDILRMRTRLLLAACAIFAVVSIALGYRVWLS